MGECFFSLAIKRVRNILFNPMFNFVPKCVGTKEADYLLRKPAAMVGSPGKCQLTQLVDARKQENRDVINKMVSSANQHFFQLESFLFVFFFNKRHIY